MKKESLNGTARWFCHGTARLWYGTAQHAYWLRAVTHVSHAVTIRVPDPSLENLARHVVTLVTCN